MGHQPSGVAHLPIFSLDELDLHASQGWTPDALGQSNTTQRLHDLCSADTIG
jgi:hypothetical protein